MNETFINNNEDIMYAFLSLSSGDTCTINIYIHLATQKMTKKNAARKHPGVIIEKFLYTGCSCGCLQCYVLIN